MTTTIRLTRWIGSRNPSIWVLVLSLAIATLRGVPAAAAIIYVDKEKSCPGAGTDSRPYCSIRNAFEVVNPGDDIRIRNSATPYDESAIATRSGTAAAPIIIEPDTGHHPILRYTGKGAMAAVIKLQYVDYWTIRNLTFDGSGVWTSSIAV